MVADVGERHNSVTILIQWAASGDYAVPVENVCGHLAMARENVAKVLAKRIAEKQMTESQAIEMARGWFWDNPKALYRLNV